MKMMKPCGCLKYWKILETRIVIVIIIIIIIIIIIYLLETI